MARPGEIIRTWSTGSETRALVAGEHIGQERIIILSSRSPRIKPGTQVGGYFADGQPLPSVGKYKKIAKKSAVRQYRRELAARKGREIVEQTTMRQQAVARGKAFHQVLVPKEQIVRPQKVHKSIPEGEVEPTSPPSKFQKEMGILGGLYQSSRDIVQDTYQSVKDKDMDERELAAMQREMGRRRYRARQEVKKFDTAGKLFETGELTPEQAQAQGYDVTTTTVEGVTTYSMTSPTLTSSITSLENLEQKYMNVGEDYSAGYFQRLDIGGEKLLKEFTQSESSTINQVGGAFFGALGTKKGREIVGTGQEAVLTSLGRVRAGAEGSYQIAKGQGKDFQAELIYRPVADITNVAHGFQQTGIAMEKEIPQRPVTKSAIFTATSLGTAGLSLAAGSGTATKVSTYIAGKPNLASTVSGLGQVGSTTVGVGVAAFELEMIGAQPSPEARSQFIAKTTGTIVPFVGGTLAGQELGAGIKDIGVRFSHRDKLPIEQLSTQLGHHPQAPGSGLAAQKKAFKSGSRLPGEPTGLGTTRGFQARPTPFDQSSYVNIGGQDYFMVGYKPPRPGEPAGLWASPWVSTPRFGISEAGSRIGYKEFLQPSVLPQAVTQPQVSRIYFEGQAQAMPRWAYADRTAFSLSPMSRQTAYYPLISKEAEVFISPYSIARVGTTSYRTTYGGRQIPIDRLDFLSPTEANALMRTGRFTTSSFTSSTSAGAYPSLSSYGISSASTTGTTAPGVASLPLLLYTPRYSSFTSSNFISPTYTYSTAVSSTSYPSTSISPSSRGGTSTYRPPSIGISSQPSIQPSYRSISPSIPSYQPPSTTSRIRPPTGTTFVPTYPRWIVWEEEEEDKKKRRFRKYPKTKYKYSLSFTETFPKFRSPIKATTAIPSGKFTGFEVRGYLDLPPFKKKKKGRRRKK